MSIENSISKVEVFLTYTDTFTDQEYNALPAHVRRYGSASSEFDATLNTVLDGIQPLDTNNEPREPTVAELISCHDVLRYRDLEQFEGTRFYIHPSIKPKDQNSPFDACCMIGGDVDDSNREATKRGFDIIPGKSFLITKVVTLNTGEQIASSQWTFLNIENPPKVMVINAGDPRIEIEKPNWVPVDKALEFFTRELIAAGANPELVNHARIAGRTPRLAANAYVNS